MPEEFYDAYKEMVERPVMEKIADDEYEKMLADSD